MRPECISRSIKEQQKLTALEFERANFPHCLRTVGGKHIKRKTRTERLNVLQLQGFFPIVLMAIADTKYRSVYVDIGRYRKDCDSAISNDICYGHQFRQICCNKQRPLAGTDGPNVPYFFVGDEGFALNKNILRPFGGSKLSV
jgi:hypothetical protein